LGFFFLSSFLRLYFFLIFYFDVYSFMSSQFPSFSRPFSLCFSVSHHSLNIFFICFSISLSHFFSYFFASCSLSLRTVFVKAVTCDVTSRKPNMFAAVVTRERRFFVSVCRLQGVSQTHLLTPIAVFVSGIASSQCPHLWRYRTAKWTPACQHIVLCTRLGS
jgi:hypothetical protein